MCESLPSDSEVLREIIRQGMTDEEYRNFQNLEEEFDEAQELIEEDFDGEGRSCFRLLWAEFCKQMRRWRRRIIKHPR